MTARTEAVGDDPWQLPHPLVPDFSVVPVLPPGYAAAKQENTIVKKINNGILFI